MENLNENSKLLSLGHHRLLELHFSQSWTWLEEIRMRSTTSFLHAFLETGHWSYWQACIVGIDELIFDASLHIH